MVDAAGSARKRIRDYAAERARRNVLARERGFTSLDALAKARRRGEYPTAREIKFSPIKAAEARQITERRKFGVSLSDLEKMDRKSAAWSRSHARQAGTRFKKSWSPQRRRDFYNAFVRDWQVPNDERDFGPLYDYVADYPEGFEPRDYDRNPYQEK